MDDRDWIRLQKAAAAPPVAVERRLWTVAKDRRRASISVRSHPVGHELICRVGDALVWSEVQRDGRQLGVVADERLQDWLARAWRVEVEAPS